MQNNQAIFETLFNRNFSDTDNSHFLEEFTEQHPYFSPAQFFLLQNIKEDAVGFDNQAVKTNILFNNPHWLYFQLYQTHLQSQAEQNMVSPEVETSETIVEIPDPVVEMHETFMEISEQVIPETVNDLPDDTEATGTMEKEIEPMSITLKMPEQKANLSEAMLFEPMHMVDYFASQGIKLSEDVQPDDKLGKQLKSFTEWLKIMKKVHVAEETEIAVKADTNIQVLAENSNADAGVLTESMAEVFAKQGKAGKAVEVYQKLSLLNPAKSTYFAAKIENLKGL